MTDYMTDPTVMTAVMTALVITATTVQAYDRIFPAWLRMKPGTTGGNSKEFDIFVDAVVIPLYKLSDET